MKFYERKIAKFEGRDKSEPQISTDEPNEPKNKRNYCNSNQENLEYENLEDLFSDEEYHSEIMILFIFNYYRKIVYKRNLKTDSSSQFNNSIFNINKFQPIKLVSANGKVQQKSLDELENDSYDPQSKFKDYFYQPKDVNDKTLVFESKFESGNLSMASKVVNYFLI